MNDGSGNSGSGRDCNVVSVGPGMAVQPKESVVVTPKSDLLTFQFCVVKMCTRIAAPGSRYCLKCLEARYRQT